MVLNWSRLLTAACLIPVIMLARVHYRSYLNSVTVLAAPLLGAFLVQQLIIPHAAFSVSGGAVIVSAVWIFTLGAVLRPLPPAPTHLTWTFRRGRLSEIAFSGSCAVVVLLLLLGGRYVLHAYNSAGVGYVQPGLFDRSLVIDSLAGSQASYIIRIVTVLLFPGAVLIVMAYFLRARGWKFLALGYAIAAYRIALALRARLPAILILTLATLVLLVGTRQQSGRSRVRSLHLPGRGKWRAVFVVAALLLVPVAAVKVFNQIAFERHGVQATTANFAYSIAGGPSALSVALDSPQAVAAYDGRGQSIAGLLELLQSRSRTLGSFTSVIADPGQPEASSINIYTGFFLLYNDVGLVGLFLTMFAFGILSRRAYGKYAYQPTPGRLLVYVNLLFLLACMPVTVLSSYNFWWLLFLGAPLLSALVTITSADAATDDAGNDVGEPHVEASFGQPTF